MSGCAHSSARGGSGRARRRRRENRAQTYPQRAKVAWHFAILRSCRIRARAHRRANSLPACVVSQRQRSLGDRKRHPGAWRKGRRTRTLRLSPPLRAALSGDEWPLDGVTLLIIIGFFSDGDVLSRGAAAFMLYSMPAPSSAPSSQQRLSLRQAVGRRRLRAWWRWHENCADPPPARRRRRGVGRRAISGRRQHQTDDDDAGMRQRSAYTSPLMYNGWRFLIHCAQRGVSVAARAGRKRRAARATSFSDKTSNMTKLNILRENSIISARRQMGRTGEKSMVALAC